MGVFWVRAPYLVCLYIKADRNALTHIRTSSPGDAFIRSGMWLEVGSILATFNIQKAVDANGNPIEVSGEVDSGILWYVPLSIHQSCSL